MIHWPKNRKTAREEDPAYSLLGNFDIYVPVMYKERETKVVRQLVKDIYPMPRTTRGIYENIMWPTFAGTRPASS